MPLTREILSCDAHGIPVEWEQGEAVPVPEGETYSLCRCGQSGKLPFCDGTHVKTGFVGAETAALNLFQEQAQIISGPELNMADAKAFCISAGFCHRGGDSWSLTRSASDSKSVETVIRNAGDCPSGRLVAIDKETGVAIEPDLEPSIGIIEIPSSKISGPLWVKGGIPIFSADGRQYEVRNRVTLCRCGHSRNMPFCDGSHFSVGFNDGNETVR